VVENTKASLPIVSLVGGKLTTMRSLAEESAAVVLKRLGREVTANSRTRPFPGSEGFPTEPAAHLALVQEIAERTGYSDANVAAAMTLHGTRCDAILSPGSDRRLLPDSELPLVLARWAIEEEHAVTLADLVERRLMLLYHARLTRACLQKLAGLLAERGRLEEANIETAVDAEVERLASRYGKTVR
jgi:glycerol-3-phosphate dehydrogenase